MERENEEEQEELEREDRQTEGLIGDTEENRNLSGSTTWETLPDQGPAGDEDDDEEQN
jgi:hypothetical protein